MGIYTFFVRVEGKKGKNSDILFRGNFYLVFYFLEAQHLNYNPMRLTQMDNKNFSNNQRYYRSSDNIETRKVFIANTVRPHVYSRFLCCRFLNGDGNSTRNKRPFLTKGFRPVRGNIDSR